MQLVALGVQLKDYSEQLLILLQVLVKGSQGNDNELNLK